MTRDQLEHLLRAASRITGDRDVIVVGSQAILGTYSDRDLPDEAIGSIEVDVCFGDDSNNEKSDLVDGAIGELSAFHEQFGVYAQGVSLSTAVLPGEWEARLVVLETPDTAPGRGLCLERHDLVVSKLVARRNKDYDFVEALLRAGLVDATTCRQRLRATPIREDQRSLLDAWLARRL